MTRDEMEDKGLIEICRNCGSMHLIEHSPDQIECRDCGAVNYTEYIQEIDLDDNGRES